MGPPDFRDSLDMWRVMLLCDLKAAWVHYRGLRQKSSRDFKAYRHELRLLRERERQAKAQG